MTTRPGLTAGSNGHRIGSFLRGLDRSEKRSLIGMGSVIVVLHLIGFGVFLALVVPQHFSLGSETPVFGVGVGVLAYTFGLRHAFDADHIAAVDNATRKLLSDAAASGELRRPFSVGFWFSLGHSTVVFALAFLLAIGTRALAGEVEDGSSLLHSVTAVIGASVSGIFLWILGILNLVVLIGIIKVFRAGRRGHYDEQELEVQLNKRGFMNRILGGMTKLLTKSWHIYPIGVLFGLGFDTATEVGLLVLASGAAAFQLPLYAILVLPVLFAAGMCLMDTIDGVLMTGAYGWAFLKPVRKIYYNLIITSISVAVALVIGTIELVGVVANQARIVGGPLAAIASFPLDYAGFIIVGVFIIVWIAAVLIWKYARVEERWSESTQAGGSLSDRRAEGRPSRGRP